MASDGSAPSAGAAAAAPVVGGREPAVRGRADACRADAMRADAMRALASSGDPGVGGAVVSAASRAAPAASHSASVNTSYPTSSSRTSAVSSMPVGPSAPSTSAHTYSSTGPAWRGMMRATTSTSPPAGTMTVAGWKARSMAPATASPSPSGSGSRLRWQRAGRLVTLRMVKERASAAPAKMEPSARREVLSCTRGTTTAASAVTTSRPPSDRHSMLNRDTPAGWRYVYAYA